MDTIRISITSLSDIQLGQVVYHKADPDRKMVVVVTGYQVEVKYFNFVTGLFVVEKVSLAELEKEAFKVSTTELKEKDLI